jgi:glycosyltransferase involved in cell wall biosynthesis
VLTWVSGVIWKGEKRGRWSELSRRADQPMGLDVTRMNTLAVLRALRALPGGRQGANAARRSGLPRGHLRTAYDVEVGLLKSGWLEAQAAASGLACAAIRAHGAGDLGIVAQLLDVVRRHSISLMHAHEFYMTLVGAVASRLARIPLVVTVHGKNYYPDKRRRRLIYRVAAMQASRVATVSRDLAQFFCRTTGTPASREVVYNGIDVESLAGVSRDWDERAAG